MKSRLQANRGRWTRTALLPSSASSSVGRKFGAPTSRFRIWRSLPRPSVARRASRWCASKPAKFGSRAQHEMRSNSKGDFDEDPPIQRGPALEVENDSARKLEVVL